MLKIKQDDMEIKIVFHRRKRQDGRKELIDTACEIWYSDAIYQPLKIGVGIAKQNPLDAYNKITGKKIALDRAMQATARLDNITPFYDIDLRRKVWQTFHDEFKRWR